MAAIFLAGMPLFKFWSDKAEANLIQESLTVVLEGDKLVILEGNTLLAISNPSNPEPKITKKLAVIVTAYSSTVWETDDDPYLTAAGTWVRDGIIANNILPFGTKVRLPEIYGDKIFVVEDRMSWKKGNYHIDVWLPSYWEAKSFGAKQTYIEILEN